MTTIPTAPRLAALAILSLALLSPSFAPTAAAQGATPFTWAAKVDEEIITGYDVAQRARLLALESGNSDVARVALQAREELIDEALKTKEATRRGVKVTKEQVAQAVATIAKNNRTTTEAFIARLKSGGVDRATFERRVKVTLAWNEMLRRNHLSKIRPTDGEVETEVNAAQASPKGPTVYSVKQIVVDVGPAADRKEVENAARKAISVRSQLKSCTQIKELAPKYSRISGDLGWVRAEQMPPPVRKAVLELKPGQTTRPMRSQNGFHVIMLCDVRSTGGAKPTEAAIKDQLTARKAEIVSRSLVADLRNDAMIERAQ